LLARVTASIADDLIISNDFQITAKVKSSGVIVSGDSQPVSFRVSSAPSYTKFYRLGNLEPLKDSSLITEGIKIDAGISLGRSNTLGLRENLKNFSVDLTYSLANSANTTTYPSTIKLINWTDDATNPTKYSCKDTNGAKTTCQEVARTADSVTIRLSFEANNPAVGIGTNFDANIFIWLPASEVSNSTGCKYTCKLQVVASNFQTPSQTPNTAGLYGLSGNLDKGVTATTNSVFFSKNPTVTFAGNTSLEP
jgi:hypothetical protein